MSVISAMLTEDFESFRSCDPNYVIYYSNAIFVKPLMLQCQRAVEQITMFSSWRLSPS